MGQLLSSLRTFLDPALKDRKILILGLDAAGKSTLLYRLKLGETVTTIPTIGFNVETVEMANGLKFTMWDVGGQGRIIQMWSYYFPGTDGLVFMVDAML